MTREENTKKLVELRATAESMVSSYNEAMQTSKLDEANKIDAKLTEVINEYTSIVRTMCFEDCRDSEDPMLTAVKTLSFVTIAVKDEKKEDEKIPVRSIIDREKQIDLYKLHKFVDGGIGADKNWVYQAEKLNFLFTVQRATDLGVPAERLKEINDSYAMSTIAKEFDAGKNPVSKTNILKTMQSLVTAMLGEGYKATSHDVNFILSVYARKNRKALTVSCANHKYFRNYMAEVCHRIVTGKTYDVEFKADKK